MQEEHKTMNSSERRTEPNLYEDIGPVYANNVRFETSAWDLRILFGQLMPEASRPSSGSIVDWHTDVTIPWTQAKLMHFFLGLNLTLYEAENGKIKLPMSVLPPTIPETPPGEIDQANLQAMSAFEMVKNLVNGFREAQIGKS